MEVERKAVYPEDTPPMEVERKAVYPEGTPWK